MLERVNDERSQELGKARQSAEGRRAQVEELQAQQRRIREEAERTQSVKLNEQERREIELNIRVGQAQEELRVLRD